MSHKFPTVSPADLFVCVDPRPTTNEERSSGLSGLIPGYRTGNNSFIDYLLPFVHAKGALPVKYYARLLEVSVADLNGTMKVLTGCSIGEFLEDYALTMARYLLLHSNDKIIDIAQRCGYSPSGLFRVFRRRFGQSPYCWRQDHRPSQDTVSPDL